MAVYKVLYDGSNNPRVSESDLEVLLSKFNKKQINSALNKCRKKETKTSDHPPCNGCGGSFFLRTGTCHVCQTCGTSQGCS